LHAQSKCIYGMAHNEIYHIATENTERIHERVANIVGFRADFDREKPVRPTKLSTPPEYIYKMNSRNSHLRAIRVNLFR
jgi:hypothetical protein